MIAAARHQGAKQRLIHEMRSYALTVLYLAIRFGAVQACQDPATRPLHRGRAG